MSQVRSPAPPSPSTVAERLSAAHNREREAYARLEAELMTPEMARVYAGSNLGGDDLTLTDSDLEEYVRAEVDSGAGVSYASELHRTSGSAVESPQRAASQSIGASESPVDDSAEEFMFDGSEMTGVDDTVPSNDLSNDNFSIRTPARAPRYLMQTQNSMNRTRTAAENNLRVVRRQHERSEKLRTELVLRKSKLDVELSRTQKKLRESKAKQQVIKSENQALKAQIIALERDNEQLRGAMAHQANVNKNAQVSAKRRLAKAEERLRAAELRADTVAVRNDTLLEANRQQADLAQQVARLEEDKKKLMASLAKTRRKLADQRDENSEMSRLRYDLELAKAEGKEKSSHLGVVLVNAQYSWIWHSSHFFSATFAMQTQSLS